MSEEVIAVAIPEEITDSSNEKEGEHEEEEESIDNEEGTQVVLDKDIIIPTTSKSKKTGKETTKNTKYHIKVTNELVGKDITNINIRLTQYEDIFFLITSNYDQSIYLDEMPKMKYVIDYDQMSEELVSMFESFIKDENEFYITLDLGEGEHYMHFVQNIQVTNIKLMDIKFISASTEESDKLGQDTYAALKKQLDLTKKRFDAYNAALLKKNPVIYDDIQINGEDFIRTPEEKKKEIEMKMEANEKIAKGLSKMQHKTLVLPKPLI